MSGKLSLFFLASLRVFPYFFVFNFDVQVVWKDSSICDCFQQRACIDFAINAKPLTRYMPENKLSFQYKMWKFVVSPPFEYAIMTLIALNTVVLMMKVRQACSRGRDDAVFSSSAKWSNYGSNTCRCGYHSKSELQLQHQSTHPGFCHQMKITKLEGFFVRWIENGSLVAQRNPHLRTVFSCRQKNHLNLPPFKRFSNFKEWFLVMR